MQATSNILMIRPVHFTFNAETAVNNAFQVKGDSQRVHENALKEFDAFVQLLRGHGVHVTVIDDTPDPHTPDSIFPNNWISFHENGTVILYPMYAPNRRLERKSSVIEKIRRDFRVENTIDISSYEKQDKFLEGTGSMVLDRDNKVAYACLSPRTDLELLQEFCNRIGYRPVTFTALDSKGKHIYHTNVMMCVADRYVVICMETIREEEEKKQLSGVIRSTGKEIIEISMDQMKHFAGNMLQVANDTGMKFLVMSTQAYISLNSEQKQKLERFNPIIHSPLDTIESNGGGSARCMMAEIFLKPQAETSNFR